jgi:mannose-6-phosphate isomerase-like protein (cupin superfamily)
MNARIRLSTFALGAAVLAAACEQSKQPSQSGAEPLQASSETSSTGAARKGFVQNIEKLTEENDDFRRVLYTAKHLQLVIMSLPPGEHIGLETHDVDQFFRIESGNGEVVIDDDRSPIGPGSSVVVPAGSRHDFLNTGKAALKLYTIYAPPNHRDGVVHHTRADAEKDAERFDGKTTE